MEINEFADWIVDLRKKKGFKTSWYNVAEKTMLVITELGRAVDADRKGNKDLVKHELVDALTRLLDQMRSLGMDIDKDLDHNLRAWSRRVYRHGKRY